jgi:hypothetical protein
MLDASAYLAWFARTCAKTTMVAPTASMNQMTGNCTLPIARIAKRANIRTAKVRAAIRLAEGLGLIAIESTRGTRHFFRGGAPAEPVEPLGTFSGVRTGSLGAGSFGLGVGFGNTTGLGIVSGISMGSEPG